MTVSPSMQRRRVIVALVGGLLLVPFGLLLWAVGVPWLFSPMPLVLVVPAFLSVPAPVVAALPALIFWTVGWSLLAGREQMRLGPLIFYGVMGALNVAYLVLGWRYGLRFQGPLHTVVVSVLSLALFAGGAALAVLARRRPSFGRHFAAQWVLGLWLVWYAFPYLGELP